MLDGAAEAQARPAPGNAPGSGGPSLGRRGLVLGAGAALVVVAAALGLTRSPIFAADRLVVDGVHRLDPARVLKIAGIAEGESVVWFDADEARRRLEAEPWIAEATVRSDLPDTIAVRIRERVPVGAIETHAGWEVLAADGVVLAHPADAPNLPAITALVPGHDVVSLGTAILGAMEAELRARVVTLTVGADGLVRLGLRGGVPVMVGETDEADAKAQALAAVLEWARAARADVRAIDVSVPGAPTARLAEGRLAGP